jgi:hypothetical protein
VPPADSLKQRRAPRAILGAVLLGCASDASVSDTRLATTLAECGSSLDVLLDRPRDVEPSFAATYSEARAGWLIPGESCGLGAFAGECADGKRLLYRNGGFVSEIRYFDGEQMVGFVGSGDVAICPSVCPLSRFYGDIGSVRCDSPVFEVLCSSPSSGLDGDQLWMPFANGEAPGGCGSF